MDIKLVELTINIIHFISETSVFFILSLIEYEYSIVSIWIFFRVVKVVFDNCILSWTHIHIFQNC